MRAQRAHDGFWVGFGAGLVKSSDNYYGLGMYLRLGGTVSHQVLVGVEGQLVAFPHGGFLSYNEVSTDGAWYLSPVAMLYPWRGGGVFVKPGIGLVAAFDDSESSRLKYSVGLGTTIGVGLDLKLGRNRFLTPTLEWHRFLTSTLDRLTPSRSVTFALGLRL